MGRNDEKHEFSLKEALQQWVDKSRYKQKYNEAQIVEGWEKLMGKTIASYTDKVFVKNHTLYIKVNSAPLKHQLHMSKSRIIERCSELYGPELILDIKLL